MRKPFTVYYASKHGPARLYGEYRTWPQVERAIRRLLHQGRGGSWYRRVPGRDTVWGWFLPYTEDIEAEVVTARELSGTAYRHADRWTT